MEALFEQLCALADMAVDGRGFDTARLDGVLALFDGEARAALAAAEEVHEAAARGTEAAMEAAQGHLNAIMDAAVGKYRGSSGEADALSAATTAMDMAFKATTSNIHRS
uniref:Uncharacterized protein n=1 Tax=Oryza punctata TaxID=4537 RepID=A0A0E0L967_ORYPU